MAIGTGLPLQEKTGFAPVEPPPIVGGHDFGAAAFGRSADAYEKVGKVALSTAELAQHKLEQQSDQLRAGQLANEENITRRYIADLTAKETTAEGGPDANRALETGNKELARRMTTISDPKLQEAVKKDFESRITGVYTGIQSHNASNAVNMAHQATNENIKAQTEEWNTSLIKGDMFDENGNYTQTGQAQTQKIEYTTAQAVKNGQHPEAWRQNILNGMAGNAAGVTIGRKVYEAAASGKISEDEVQAEIRRNTVENKSLNPVMQGLAYTKANEYFQAAWKARKTEVSGARTEARTLKGLYATEGIDAISMNDHTVVRDNLIRYNAITEAAELDQARAKAAAKASITSAGPAAVQQGLAAQAATEQGVTEGDIAAFKRSEGFEPRAKWDYKQYSGGYGTVAAFKGQEFTEESADTALRAEVAKDAAWLNQQFPGLREQNKGAWSALLSLSHNSDRSWANKGLGNLVRQSMETGDWSATASRFLEYNKAGGSYIPGLQNRRNREVQWFFNGVGPEGGGTAPPVSVASPFPEGQPRGLITAGNINLYDRPIVDVPGAEGQPPGKATVRSITVEMDGKHYVLPTVVQVGDAEARVVSNDEAVANFKQTGQHLGEFKTKQDAERYARDLHEAQAEFYGMTPRRRMAVPTAAGAVEQPTINLSRRAGPITNAIVIEDGGKQVLIPTRSAETGDLISSDEAIKQYKETGDHYGKFTTLADANKFATALREPPTAAVVPRGTARPPTTTGGGGGQPRQQQGPPPPPGPGGRVPTVPMEAPAQTPTQSPGVSPSVGGVPREIGPTIGGDTVQQSARYAPASQARIFEKAYYEESEKWLKENWKEMAPLVKQGKMAGIDQGTMFNIVDSPYVKDGKFAAEVKASMMAGAFSRDIESLPAEQRRAAMLQFEASMREQHVPPNIAKQIMDDIEKTTKDQANLAATDPQGYRRAQGASPLTPFNINDPQQSAQAMKERKLTAETVASENHLPAGKLLSADDERTLAFAITNGNEQQVKNATEVLRLMTGSEMRTQFQGQSVLHEALMGAQSSTDYFRYDGVHGLLSKWQTDNPTGFAAAIRSSDSVDRLDAWSLNKNIYSPQQQIEFNNKLSDPQFKEILKKAQEADGDIGKAWAKVKPDELIRYINPTIINKYGGGLVTQGQPESFEYRFGNPFVMQQFEADYKNVYTRLRAQNMPHDAAMAKAAEVLGRTWGVSAANNGTLMRYPPEQMTKRDGEENANVGNSMDWSVHQLYDAVDQHYGQRPLPFARDFLSRAGGPVPSTLGIAVGGIAGAVYAATPGATPASVLTGARRYTPSNIIADKQTDLEVSQQRKGGPTYGVIVNTPDGRKEVMVDANGDPVRVSFDRETAINEYNKSYARVHHERLQLGKKVEEEQLFGGPPGTRAGEPRTRGGPIIPVPPPPTVGAGGL